MARTQQIIALIFALLLLSCAANKRKERERIRRIMLSSASYHIDKAFAAADSGHFDQAIGHLREAIRLAPTEPVAFNNIGAAFYHIGRIDSATKYYQAAIRLRPSYVHAYSNLAQAYMAQKNYSSALLAINSAVKYDPSFSNLYVIKGLIYDKQNLLDEAILNFKHAISLDSTNDDIHNSLGSMYYKKGMLNDAIAEYKKAIKLNPKSAQSYFNLGNTFARKCLLQEALEQYDKALEMKPDLVSVLNNRGLVFMALGDAEAALQDFRTALTFSSESSIVPFNISIAMQRLDSLDSALYFVDSAIKKDSSNALFYMQKGNIFLSKGDGKKALYAFDKAVKIDPELAIVYNNLGNAFAKTNDPDDARLAFEKALQLYPDYLDQRYFSRGKLVSSGISDLLGGCQDAQSLATDYAGIYNNLGKTYLQLGLIPQATNTFKRAAEIQPLMPEAFENLSASYQIEGKKDLARQALAKSQLNRARIYFSSDSLRTTEKICQQALQLDPTLAAAFSLLGRVYERRGRQHSANIAFKKALKANVANAQVHLAYGQYLSRQKKWKQAIAHFRRAIVLQSSLLPARQGLADALAKINKEADARSERAKAYFLAGQRLEYASRWDAAMEEYIKAAALDSNNADYIASQGLINAKKHLNPEAEQLFARALEKDALNALALLGMGLVRGDQRRTKEAIEFLEKAVERDPSSARAHYALAVNYYFDGQIDAAWNQVIQAKNLGMIVKEKFLDELKKAKKQ